MAYFFSGRGVPAVARLPPPPPQPRPQYTATVPEGPRHRVLSILSKARVAMETGGYEDSYSYATTYDSP